MAGHAWSFDELFETVLLGWYNMGMNDDDRLKRIGEILDTLREQALPPEELANLERELDQYAYVIDPHAVGIVMSSPPTAFELTAFAERLKNRQGTTMPDFEQLWRKKAELDRKLLDEPPHDRP